MVSVLLLVSGCMPRQADGTYPKSVYSYHPYNKYHQDQVRKDNRVGKHNIANTQKVTRQTERYNTSYNAFNRTAASKPLPKLRYYDSYTNRVVYPTIKQEQSRLPQTKRTNAQKEAKIQSIEKLARAQLGKPYVLAGNGPENFDCSGLTKYVMEHHGINMQRASYMQAKDGMYVPRDRLQKGDLIFFDNNKRTKINHTGIYLRNNKFIHASRSNKRVLISDFRDTKYYQTHFMWGRRVVQ